MAYPSPHSRSHHRLPGAFTLIELLVVIAIIAILMGLLFPAVSSVLENARRATAKNDVVQIATAVTAYETEYGSMPFDGPGDHTGAVDATLVSILMPGPGDAPAKNRRRIVFLEVPSIQTAGRGKSGQVGGSGPYLDPWGAPYQIAADSSYDHSISADGVTIRKKVGVWNDPASHPDNPSTGKRQRRKVRSWE